MKMFKWATIAIVVQPCVVAMAQNGTVVGSIVPNYSSPELQEVGWVNPAIDDNGIVYFSDASGAVYAVQDNKTGSNHLSVLWQKDANTDYLSAAELASIEKPFGTGFTQVCSLSECAPTMGIDQSRIYLGSHTSPAWVFCVSTVDGSLIWKQQIPNNAMAGTTPGWTEDHNDPNSPVYPDRPWGSGGGIVSSPAIVQTGNTTTLYIGTGDWSEGNYEQNPLNGNAMEYHDIEDNRFFAIEDLGTSARIKWFFQPGDEVDQQGNPKYPSGTARRSFFTSPIVGSDGTIYAPCFDGYFYALTDTTIGGNDTVSVKWSWLSINACNDGIPEQEWWGSPTMTDDGTKVLAGSNDGFLHCFNTNATGSNNPVWSFEAWGEVYATPVITNTGKIIITSEGKASDDVPEPGCPQWPTHGVGSHLFAIDLNGNELWRYPQGQGPDFFYGQSAALENGKVVISAETNNEFWLIDPEVAPPTLFTTDPSTTSFIEWSAGVGNETRQSAAVADDGSIYVCGGNDGGLFKIEGDSPLASTGYPRMQGNNLNCGAWECTSLVTAVESNNNQKLDFKVYPNPTDGFITIDLGQGILANLVVSDLFGRPIIQQQNIVEITALNLEAEAPGIYIITVLTQHGKVSKRIIKT